MIEIHLISLLSSLVQVTAFVALLPMFGDRRISPRLRLVLVFFISSLLYSSRVEDLTLSSCAILPMSNIILRSLILGLVAGIFMRIPIIVAHMLGSLISQLGSYSQIFGPGFLEDSTLVLGSVLSFFVMFALAALDYHLLLIDLLMSFPFECAQASSPSVLFNSFLKGEVRFILDTFFVLSQPFILISLLYYSCIGLINRAMPQFMSTFIGTPALQILMLLTLFAATDSIVRSVLSLVLLRDVSFDL